MILQALNEYYDRMASDSNIAPLGWEWKRIPFLVIIDRNGNFIRLEDTRDNKDKRLQAKSFLVPSLGEAKGNGIKANLFWENAEYFFGCPLDNSKLKKNSNKYMERLQKQHAAFIQRIKALAPILESNVDFSSVIRFAEKSNFDEVFADPLWEEAVHVNQAFLICISEKGPVPNIPEIKNALMIVQAKQQDGADLIRCLVTGELDMPSRLEPDIKGVRDAKPTGAHLVAVNNKISGAGNGGATPSFASFMKEQGANSPIGKRASLAYTTALNTLLGKDSHQKMQVGDATTVFWASKPTTLEDDFADIFSEPPKDEPNKNSDAVERLLSSVKTGAFMHETDDTRFYVLGLSPNTARISVRFWHDGTVSEMEQRFADWFENLKIVHDDKECEHLSLWRLLCSLAPQGKSDNIPPNLAGAVMRSILEGTPYPSILLSSALVRIKAEQKVDYPRAKIIKAFLNHNYQRKLTMSLDKDNTNIGYRLGRLFAMLEKIQEIANPGLNATIRDKFYASASATPSAVFGNLMRLSGHHLSKLDSEKKGLRVWLEKQVEEIMSEISSFPAHMSLEEQGMFAIGYYHQRMTKKEDI